MQDLLVQRYEVATHGVYRVPYSVLTPFSWVDLRDVAEAAATVLTQPGLADFFADELPAIG